MKLPLVLGKCDCQATDLALVLITNEEGGRFMRVAAVLLALAVAAHAASAQTPSDTNVAALTPSAAPHVRPPSSTGLASEVSSDLDTYYDQYQAFKQGLQNNYNIQYSVQVSILPQWGVPNGGPGTVQLLTSPTITWTPFTDTSVGSGSFTFAMEHYHFWTKADTTSQLAHMGMLTPPNPQVSNGYEYTTITYTHTLPGNWKWLSATVGVFEIDTFDDNEYANSQQTNFINYALAQNGTQAYVTNGLGAYLQATSPDGQFVLSGGFQDATDVVGTEITTRGFSTGKYTYFADLNLVPHLLPGTTISILWYSQPAVPQQPFASQGVSFSASHDFGKQWALFLRANNASGAAIPIETSIAGGAIYNNPFHRNKMDQAGLALFWSKTNLSAVTEPVRRSETGVELYYNYTIFKGMQLTPDVQVYTNPAFPPGSGPAAVFTLRTTFFL